MEIHESIRILHKWLNEEQEQIIDKVALAWLIWYSRDLLETSKIVSRNLLDVANQLAYGDYNGKSPIPHAIAVLTQIAEDVNPTGELREDAPHPNNPVKVGGIVR
jgi:hypothetical protein